jgi:hypothetical protein
VFQRFFQVACSLAALLAALLLAIPLSGADLPPTWPVYLAGSIVFGFEAVRPTLLKGRLVWIAVATATLAGMGFGYPYPWIVKRGDSISVNLYLLGFGFLFWVCAAAAVAVLILGLRVLIARSPAEPAGTPRFGAGRRLSLSHRLLNAHDPGGEIPTESE